MTVTIGAAGPSITGDGNRPEGPDYKIKQTKMNTPNIKELSVEQLKAIGFDCFLSNEAIRQQQAPGNEKIAQNNANIQAVVNELNRRAEEDKKKAEEIKEVQPELPSEDGKTTGDTN